MFEQDFILREIEQMVAAILKFVFGKDIGYSSSLSIDNLNKKEKSDELLRMIDNGKIYEAIEELYNCTGKNKDDLLIGFNFFSYLCGKSEDFYEKYNILFLVFKLPIISAEVCIMSGIIFHPGSQSVCGHCFHNECVYQRGIFFFYSTFL